MWKRIETTILIGNYINVAITFELLAELIHSLGEGFPLYKPVPACTH